MQDDQANNPSPETPKSKQGFGAFAPVTGSIRLFRRWWRVAVRADVNQQAVINKVREDSGFTPHFAFMTSMSAGIAILGLLLSSPAVVIGAMLLSPLMGPIMGAGFALAVGDSVWLKESGKAILLGTIISILFAGLVVTMSPLQMVTAEIASRTRPNLFDLAVALFSALAGAYAMIRGRMGTIVGVAIATALMPPLAVVGFGLATLNWSVFGGSLLLFFTNLMTIALTATGMARLYGFRSHLSERQSQVQVAIMAVVFVALAIPLGLSLRQIAWEVNVSRSANGYIKDQFGSSASVSKIEIDFDAQPIVVNATVFTPKILADANEQSTRVISRTVGRSVVVKITQFKVESGAEAHAAELAAAGAQAQAQEAEIQLARLRENLALIAGVSVDEVTLDTAKRRALVIAKPLPGASLASYYTLERRVAAKAKDWNIKLQPPTVALPELTITDGALASTSSADLELIVWASERLNLPLGITGSAEGMAVAKGILQARNVTVAQETEAAAPDGGISLRWAAPAESTSLQQ
ncbi:DUF389 domain-containing protein [Parasphingorhabdus sp.]|uniref:DUF389 domain-containing protein n=1 Tax=Parasphingorhabdus sp. TaxID=2709688 RepID=UPI003A921E4C